MVLIRSRIPQLNGPSREGYFHVSGILETSKHSNKLDCQIDVVYALETSEPYSGDLGSESDVSRAIGEIRQLADNSLTS